jgi:succinyl-CoA synthetase alpha subunit
MSVYVDQRTRVVVQGATGREGAFHTGQMVAYGTAVVAGVTPGKGGGSVHGVPVFNTVAAAVRATGANCGVIFVPARFCPDAILEAADAGLDPIVAITEGVPVRDMTTVVTYVQGRGLTLIGPNCPGLLTPGGAKVGIIPGNIVQPGPVGVVSRSGTLTYEVLYALTERGIGQSTAVGIGGDPVQGTKFVDVLARFQADPATEVIVLIGEIGGSDEEAAATYIEAHVTKPVVAFVAGQTAPPGRRMGHAGAIISGGHGTAAEKIAAFQAVGVEVARHPDEIAERVVNRLQGVPA